MVCVVHSVGKLAGNTRPTPAKLLQFVWRLVCQCKCRVVVGFFSRAESVHISDLTSQAHFMASVKHCCSPECNLAYANARVGKSA